MAFYFGQGATYDSIEGQFRLFKKAGKDLITEAETEGRSELPARGKSAPNTPRKPKAPKKAAGSQDGVMTGRVTKNASPKKGGKVKQEKLSSATSSFFADTPESMVDAVDGDDEMPFSETHGQFDDRFNPVSEFDELDLGLGI
ncbi:hypothetical protein W97_08875 [Coniosporium apollinis CBS 100218]|uniref:Uncharacterized protein n=1 Tax=Coniosporium apollinis (strain CBS 100218) TaxID=1168221 RepID=R7Z623_CONA1|nr:uncharacterized protein W97_08875 [Coniosporium apollinis CBS 100218]EON69615.1 hypothetical protein W97_08875 [Coniosporium apollinis CBS 100218]